MQKVVSVLMDRRGFKDKIYTFCINLLFIYLYPKWSLKKISKKFHKTNLFKMLDLFLTRCHMFCINHNGLNTLLYGIEAALTSWHTLCPFGHRSAVQSAHSCFMSVTKATLQIIFSCCKTDVLQLLTHCILSKCAEWRMMSIQKSILPLYIFVLYTTLKSYNWVWIKLGFIIIFKTFFVILVETIWYMWLLQDCWIG